MNREPVTISRALISVSDKAGLMPLAQLLADRGIHIISTGGTAKLLRSHQIPVTAVSDYTQFPEMMDGRVKTLHPVIAGGILGQRDHHAMDAQKHQIPWIDLVICNLYPFAQTIENPQVSEEDAVEQIDIGGPTMVRAAAKNFPWVAVVTDTSDYSEVMQSIEENGTISFSLRRKLAAKAFAHTASYDALIHQYLNDQLFPETLVQSYSLHTGTSKDDRLLRYGENPHQKAAVYRAHTVAGKRDSFSLLDCSVLQGKQLSFNNLGDTYGAIDTLREFTEPACVVVKHATPCGVAVGETITDAARRAYDADSVSAFGGIVVVNRTLDAQGAQLFAKRFLEVIAAPSYTEEALVLLAKKKNLRVIEMGTLLPLTKTLAPRALGNDLLLQEKDHQEITESMLTVVTERTPSPQEIKDLLFAWKVVKHVKSNAIVTATELTTCGIGGGQVSRVDATRIALQKSGSHSSMVLASDAFFPFRDSIDELKGSPVTAIIQPGGSIRDEEVIAACNEAQIAMVFTGVRSFLHG